ncbi:MAG: BON domain-containing protein [Alphaproteobacteria bacterium]
MTTSDVRSPLMTTARLAGLLVTGALLIGSLAGTTYAQDAVAPSIMSPDNAQATVQDQSAQKPTADQAGNSLSDRQIMQRIRKAVMADTSLSTAAHNVKIISVNAQVTLRGHVHSEAEKQTIEAKAVDVVGADNVIDRLSVKNKQASNQ